LSAATIESDIRARLAPLLPETLELQDESGLHVGHPGARGGGGHYRLIVVSPRFAGQSRVARHRMVYAALQPLMQHDIHALALVTRAPGEI
jgi:BolA protein